MQLVRENSSKTNLYISTFVTLLIVSILMNSAIASGIPNSVYAVIKYGCVLIVLCKIAFFTKYSPRELLIIILVMAIVSLSALKSQTNTLLFVTVFIVGAKDVSFEKIVKAFFYTSFVLIVGMFLLSILGVIPNNIYYREAIPRYSFGSNYPTDFGAHIFYLVAAFSYLKRKSYGYGDGLISIGMAFFIWKFCDARLDAGLILVLCVGLLILAKHRFNFKYFFDSCVIFLPLTYILSSFSIIFLTIRYNDSSKVYTKLNYWLSERLSIGHLGIDTYGIKIFGQYIEQHGWGGMTDAVSGYTYFFLDSSYIQLLLVYGLAAIVVFIGCFTYVGFKRLNEQRLVLVLILSVIAVSGIVDQHIFEIAFNPFIYVFWDNSFGANKARLKG